MTIPCDKASRNRPRHVASVLAIALLSSACGGGGSGANAPQATDIRPLYKVTDAGPRGNFVVARDLDDAGRVVGNCSLDASPTSTAAAFLWDAGILDEYSDRTLRALNSSGDLVGDANGVAYLWRGETAVPLAYGTAWDVSDTGVVVGEGATGNGKLHAFLWHEGQLADLGTLGGEWSVAYGVNSEGTAVGWAEQADGQVRGFIWDSAGMLAIDTLGGRWGMAYAVNDAGEVTGYSATIDGTDHAFIADSAGGVTDLGSLGGHSIGYDIDSRGRVVGESADASGRVCAFLWQESSIVDLNALIPSESGWTLTRATAINDRGQIVGEGLFNGEKRPFLLTPIDDG